MLFELERRLDGSRDLASTRLAKVLSPGSKYEPFKRAFDIAAALALLVLASPLLLAIVALVKLTSRGPAIYHQARLGRNGRPFTMLKLRTMTHDCERTTGPVWSSENDPRVTRPGRFLRRAHLDEIPQLWNILRGEMSFVGPRPERPEIVERLTREVPRYRDRLAVAPGLTGLAQVQIPPDTGLESVQSKLALDLDYVRSMGPLLDGRLLACTGLFLVGVPFRASCRLLRVPVLAPIPPSEGRPAIVPGFEVPEAFGVGEGHSTSLSSSLRIETV
jgi:lipopolysaccharide/colanic/teichoic acid biosynthesis glycosyltransferase